MKKIILFIITIFIIVVFAFLYNYYSNQNFILIFENKTENEFKKIIDEKENNIGYNVYCYNVDIKVKIGFKKYSLKDTLLKNKITVDEILEKSKLYDGTLSTKYHYKYGDYSIIKTTINKEVNYYFGSSNLNIEDVSLFEND